MGSKMPNYLEPFCSSDGWGSQDHLNIYTLGLSDPCNIYLNTFNKLFHKLLILYSTETLRQQNITTSQWMPNTHTHTHTLSNEVKQ